MNYEAKSDDKKPIFQEVEKLLDSTVRLLSRSNSRLSSRPTSGRPSADEVPSAVEWGRAHFASQGSNQSDPPSFETSSPNAATPSFRPPRLPQSPSLKHSSFVPRFSARGPDGVPDSPPAAAPNISPQLDRPPRASGGYRRSSDTSGITSPSWQGSTGPPLPWQVPPGRTSSQVFSERPRLHLDRSPSGRRDSIVSGLEYDDVVCLAAGQTEGGPQSRKHLHHMLRRDFLQPPELLRLRADLASATRVPLPERQQFHEALDQALGLIDSWEDLKGQSATRFAEVLDSRLAPIFEQAEARMRELEQLAQEQATAPAPSKVPAEFSPPPLPQLLAAHSPARSSPRARAQSPSWQPAQDATAPSPWPHTHVHAAGAQRPPEAPAPMAAQPQAAAAAASGVTWSPRRGSQPLRDNEWGATGTLTSLDGSQASQASLAPANSSSLVAIASLSELPDKVSHGPTLPPSPGPQDSTPQLRTTRSLFGSLSRQPLAPHDLNVTTSFPITHHPHSPGGKASPPRQPAQPYDPKPQPSAPPRQPGQGNSAAAQHDAWQGWASPRSTGMQPHRTFGGPSVPESAPAPIHHTQDGRQVPEQARSSLHSLSPHSPRSFAWQRDPSSPMWQGSRTWSEGSVAVRGNEVELMSNTPVLITVSPTHSRTGSPAMSPYGYSPRVLAASP